VRKFAELSDNLKHRRCACNTRRHSAGELNRFLMPEKCRAIDALAPQGVDLVDRRPALT
jgi:hypothetical protein